MSDADPLVSQSRGDLTVHVFDALAAVGVDAFVTDRFGGVSAPPFDSLNLGDHVGDDDACVQENRRRVARAAGVDAAALVIVRQIHGRDVVDADDPARADTGDVLTLREPGRAVAVLVADCVPVVLVNPTTQRLAVAHAGWRGLSVGVLGAAVAALGPTAGDVLVGLGPSISGEGYQVGPDVADRFADVPGALRADGGDRSRLDLRTVATHQLEAAGVARAHVARTAACTDGGEMFFSDRAARPCGRFGLVAKWAS